MENTQSSHQRQGKMRYEQRMFVAALPVVAAFMAVVSLLYPPGAYAQLITDEPSPLSDLELIVGNIIRAVVSLGGIALFVMLLYGGIQYLTSGGDPEGIQKAKQTLTYAVIGIALFVVAWFVLSFIAIFTGIDVIQFIVPSPSDTPKPYWGWAG